MDRHIESCSLVHEWLTKNLGQDSIKAKDEDVPITRDENEEKIEDPPFVNQFRCNLSKIVEAPMVSFPIPFWMTILEQSYPELYKVHSKIL